MIPRFRNKKMRRHRAREHKRAHDLQNKPKVVFLALILVRRVFGLEGVCEEDLHEPGAEFAGSGGDTMACAAVACWEDFCWDLLRVSFFTRFVVLRSTYNERCDVWSKIKCNVTQHVEYNQPRATRVEQFRPRTTCYDKEHEQNNKAPELDDFWRDVFHDLDHE
jgi:hypothetical protein